MLRNSKGRAAKEDGKKFLSRLATSFTGIVHWDLLCSVNIMLYPVYCWMKQQIYTAGVS